MANAQNENKQAVNWKPVIKFIIKILISGFALWWVYYCLQDIDWQASLKSISSISLTKLSLCFICTILLYLSRILRLRYWLSQLSNNCLSLKELTELYLKSVALGSITPGRIGDFSRIALLEKTGLTIKVRSKIILFDKLIDSIYILLGICLTSAIVGEKLGIPVYSLFWFGAGSLIISLIIMFWLSSIWFKNVFKVKNLLLGYCLTLIGFILYVLSNSFLFWSIGIDLTFLDVMAIVLSVGVIASLPISIGGIGIREGSLMSFLKTWHVNALLIPHVLLLEFVLNIMFPIILYFFWVMMHHLASFFNSTIIKKDHPGKAKNLFKNRWSKTTFEGKK
ncbi:MAG: hypothetical protein DRH26_12340 [Deltaproteobacteria bacterium]|nr:MAG: hypothetical protein DRH26_12340 [Deltaproteobacteria bacterium]